MAAARGTRTTRIQQACDMYAAALGAWLADPQRHHEDRPSAILLAIAAQEVRAALREAGIEERRFYTRSKS